MENNYPIREGYIELTNECRNNCYFCPKYDKTPRYMPYNLVKNVLDQINEFNICDRVFLHILGEPILHPQILKILRYAKKKQITTNLFSNGELLKHNNMDSIIHLCGDITLSGYGLHNLFSNEKYADKFKLLINSVKKENKKLTIKILYSPRWQNYIFNNSTDLNYFNKRSIHHFISKIINEVGQTDEVKTALSIVRLNMYNKIQLSKNVFIEINTFYTWGNWPQSKKIKSTRYGSCSFIDTFGILSNGDVTLCCIDHKGETKIGNVNKSSLIGILNSKERYKRIRAFKRFRVIHPVCQKCLGAKGFTRTILKNLLITTLDRLRFIRRRAKHTVFQK